MYHQKKSMEDDVDEHIKLKIKYDLSFREDKPSSFLFDILRRLDHGEELLEEDFIWLIENDLCGFLIKILDPLKKSATNAWYLIKSSRILRRMKKPNIALKITEKMQLQDNFQKSAVCTTRGAAFKDLEEFDKAIVLAEKAIYFQPENYHSYNLLGSIYYQMGDFIKGDSFFERANVLGSPTDMRESESSLLLEGESEESRKAWLKYLLKKDPQKYRWTKNYLDE